VQQGVSHGRQPSQGSQGSGGPHQSGLPHYRTVSPPRHDMPPRRDPPPPLHYTHPDGPPPYARGGRGEAPGMPPLSVAPLPAQYATFAGRGDYEEQRRVEVEEQRGREFEDPYGRLVLRRPSQPHLQQRSQSHSQVPNNMFIPSLPPGSKV